MAALIEVCAPAEESEGTRSRVLRWLKAPGDRVLRNEPLIELETDKVTVEIPAPADGVLREIHKQEQDEVAPGELLGSIDAAADADGASVATVVRTAAPPAGPAPRAAGPARAADPGSGAAGAGLMSPAVRRLLAEHRVSPHELRGSGAGGRVTAEDVLAHVAARATSATAGASPAAGAGRTAAENAALPGESPVRRVAHSAVRRRIADHMVASVRTAPHVTTVFEADLGAVLAHRERHRAGFAAGGAQLTLTAYFVAACVDAICEVPETNARWTDEALELYERIDIGIATALPDKGLVVPVIRDVAALSLEGIAQRLADLTARARDDKLTPADVRGGTFTISNHGVSGSLLAAPIVINQPQSAILGVGRLEQRAVVVETDGVASVAIRPRCYVTLTIDHRVMDGHRANLFLSVFVRRLETWQAGARPA
jgi:2-oxoglutarate dehydrogenase E2 component (dihydrolipoamide succinyltransferase)